MDLENAVWLLTGLAAVVVLLTQLRLSNEESQAGHALVPHALVNAHTVVGVLALGTWIFYLTSPNTMVGFASLAVWWLEVAIGLLILGRWMSRPSKHAAAPTGDTWGQGPGLSVLGHVGMLIGISFFTWIVLAEKLV